MAQKITQDDVNKLLRDGAAHQPPPMARKSIEEIDTQVGEEYADELQGTLNQVIYAALQKAAADMTGNLAESDSAEVALDRAIQNYQRARGELWGRRL